VKGSVRHYDVGMAVLTDQPVGICEIVSSSGLRFGTFVGGALVDAEDGEGAMRASARVSMTKTAEYRPARTVRPSVADGEQKLAPAVMDCCRAWH
jgi:hypothetical protein